MSKVLFQIIPKYMTKIPYITEFRNYLRPYHIDTLINAWCPKVSKFEPAQYLDGWQIGNIMCDKDACPGGIMEIGEASSISDGFVLFT